MPFNSLAFVVFFLAVLAVHSLPLPWIFRKLNLLIASYVFYAAWDARYVALLVFSTILNFVATRLIAHWEGRRCRRVLLSATVIINVGLLVSFKYAGELLTLAASAISILGFSYGQPDTTVLLPIGLSFFTFQAMSYTIDVYRRTIEPTPSLLDLALFISFFPVLLAGPILRAGDFLPQCATQRRVTWNDFAWGLSLLTLGEFMKITLADHLLSPIVRNVYDCDKTVCPDALSAWTGTLAFAVQDYCDFAGYSTCAMGVAFCLGFVIPPNFRAPLASIGFRDIWQRWHITLVAWMRDYVFNPLGGVYKGYRRAAANVMVVMLLIGLWHGASATFLIFGFLHGTFLIGEVGLQRTSLRRMQFWHGVVGKLSLWAATLILSLIAFVFYRSSDSNQAWKMLGSMLGCRTVSAFRLSEVDLLIAVIVVEPVFIAHWLCRNSRLEGVVARLPWWAVSIGLASMVGAILLSAGESQPFLYFRF